MTFGKIRNILGRYINLPQTLLVYRKNTDQNCTTPEMQPYANNSCAPEILHFTLLVVRGNQSY